MRERERERDERVDRRRYMARWSRLKRALLQIETQWV